MVKKWMIKALAQGVMSRLPNRTALNYLAQRYITRFFDTREREIGYRLKWSGAHLDYFRQATGRDLPNAVLELGTGWFPAVPIGLWLCGVENITTVDISGLVRRNYFAACLSLFTAWTWDDLRAMLPAAQPNRFARLQTLARANPAPDVLLRELNITARVQDVRTLHAPPGGYDLIVSNTTLEHISERLLADILRAFRRLIADGRHDEESARRAADVPFGVMSHLTDMSDHYSHFDGSITPYNFLRYQDRVWNTFFNNALLYQSRLRVSDYRRLHAQAGFTILAEFNASGKDTDHATLPLAERFRRYAPADLLAANTWQISVPIGSNPASSLSLYPIGNMGDAPDDTGTTHDDL